ncbi:MAG: group II intron reverse transcriptase domain-containing protein [Oscillospiraceae bacterium]|nr:group II intron reverse transcriptase domain-containing protein [Oscillospiraceae bacterium]
MSMLEQLTDPEVWERFYEYKASLAVPGAFLPELRHFIDEKGWEPVCAHIAAGEAFPLPSKTIISKLHTQKKRIVYTYPAAENTVLKLLTYLMLRKYDSLFSPNLYSFRPARTAKDAIRRLTGTQGIRQMFAYKVDISNYFNSVPVERLLPMLEAVMPDDPALFSFLAGLLTAEDVLDRGRVITEEKGIMAGTPQSSFYANLYLRELDALFCARGIPYARYSDDIILFAPTRGETERYAAEVRTALSAAGLSVNPSKECCSAPEDGWSFLGFYYRGGVIDIAPASVTKIKHKMRRKARALARWKARGHYSGEQAASAFIRIFNRKLLEHPEGGDLSWSCWFFPVITTAESLRIIDRYAQECLRWLISGKRTKARFDVRYDDLKHLGYESLVHHYYAYSPEAPAEQ